MRTLNPFRHPIAAIMALILLAAPLPGSPLIQAAHAMRVPQPHWTLGAALLYGLAVGLFYVVLCVVNEAVLGRAK